MNFIELEENKLKPNEHIWRYLDIHKFISFLNSMELFFTRLDLFQDPFEGVTTRLIKQRYMAKLIPSEDRLNQKLPQHAREKLLVEKKLMEKNYDEESIRKQKTQFINCWFRGERESLAMWNLYSNKESIVIRIEGRKLIDHLRSQTGKELPKFSDSDFICGPVKYFKLNPVDMYESVTGVEYSAFKKDVAFSFENEFRFLIATPSSYISTNPSYIKVSLREDFLTNFSIICHPEMAEWKVENIKSLCKGLNFMLIDKSQIELK